LEEGEVIRRLEDIERKIDDSLKNSIVKLEENAKNQGIMIEKLSSIKTSIDRTTMALIGVIGAAIGARVISSPWWLDAYAYAVFFGLIFALGTITAKKHYWLSLAVLGYSIVTISSIISLDTGGNPVLMVLANTMFGVSTLGLIIHSWREWRKK
jgi:hypothetical protein